jgi:Family of unknown function (DUF6496)
MPEEEAIERAREDEREGMAPSTQAGEFVREEMEHIREGEHDARSPEQAIAIGLSKARRAGVKLPPPKRGGNEQNAKLSVILPGDGPAVARSLRRGAHARQNARSNAKVADQRQGGHCRGTRNVWRGDALHDRARGQRRKRRAREGVVAEICSVSCRTARKVHA